jgi:hypothetical protein
MDITGFQKHDKPDMLGETTVLVSNVLVSNMFTTISCLAVQIRKSRQQFPQKKLATI